MSALLPSANTCCNPCTEPVSVAIPGPKGDTGAECDPCTDGQGAFTTADSFIMPAEGANVTVTVLNSDWLATGSLVWAQGGGAQGTFQVQSKPDSTSVILKNLEDTASGLYTDNSPPTTVFPALTSIVFAGQQGPAQDFSALDTGYMFVTTGTGVVSSQPVPIPKADGGTGSIVTSANATGYGLLGSKDAVNLNAATTDNSIAIASIRYRIDKVTIENPSGAITTATIALFTGAGATGTTLCADQSLAALTATTKFKDLATQAIVGTDVRTEATLFLRTGTAEGSAATANLRLFGWKYD